MIHELPHMSDEDLRKLYRGIGLLPAHTKAEDMQKTIEDMWNKGKRTKKQTILNGFSVYVVQKYRFLSPTAELCYENGLLYRRHIDISVNGKIGKIEVTQRFSSNGKPKAAVWSYPSFVPAYDQTFLRYYFMHQVDCWLFTLANKDASFRRFAKMMYAYWQQPVRQYATGAYEEVERGMYRIDLEVVGLPDSRFTVWYHSRTRDIDSIVYEGLIEDPLVNWLNVPEIISYLTEQSPCRMYFLYEQQ